MATKNIVYFVLLCQFSAINANGSFLYKVSNMKSLWTPTSQL